MTSFCYASRFSTYSLSITPLIGLYNWAPYRLRRCINYNLLSSTYSLLCCVVLCSAYCCSVVLVFVLSVCGYRWRRSVNCCVCVDVTVQCRSAGLTLTSNLKVSCWSLCRSMLKMKQQPWALFRLLTPSYVLNVWRRSLTWEEEQTFFLCIHGPYRTHFSKNSIIYNCRCAELVRSF